MNGQSKLLIIAAALLSLTPQMGLGSGNVVQSSCAGDFKNCQGGKQEGKGGDTKFTYGASLNAVGDKATYAITGAKATKAFGKITAAKTMKISLPGGNPNLLSSIKMYTFTPTVGSRLIKNKEQQLLFVAFDLTKALPAWTPGYVKTELSKVKSEYPTAKSAVYVYQHIAGEPATQ